MQEWRIMVRVDRRAEVEPAEQIRTRSSPRGDVATWTLEGEYEVVWREDTMYR